MPAHIASQHAGADLFNKVRETTAKLPVAAILLVGVVISALSFILVSKYLETEHLKTAYVEQGAPVAELVARSIDRDLEVVYDIAGFYAASDHVTRAEFRSFVARSLERNPSIKALEWIPRVVAADRPHFEAAARVEGFPDFQFKERSPDGEMITAAARDEYFPVYYVEPLAGNDAALGFDLASNPARHAALNRARDGGGAVATQRIKLVQETGEEFGLLVVVPIYDSDTIPTTIDARREKLSGFALAVFKIGGIVETAIASRGDLDGLDLFVYDVDASPNNRFLHYHASKGLARLARRDIDLDPENMLSALLSENGLQDRKYAGKHIDTPIYIGGREWDLLFIPSPDFRAPFSGTPWLVAALLFLATAAFTGFLRAVRIRAAKVARLVADRTSELEASNDTLKTQMELQRTIELKLNKQSDALQLIHMITAASNTAKTLEEAIQACVNYVCAYTDWPVGHAFTLDENGTGQFSSTGIWHLDDPERMEEFVAATNAISIVPDSSMIGKVIASGQPIWVRDVNQDPDFLRGSSKDGLPVKAALAFPILAGPTVVAVLEFYYESALDRNTPTLELMSQIGAQLGRIAERVSAEKQIKEREEFMRLITDNLPVLISYIDADKQLRFINEVGADWLNGHRDELINRPFEDVFGNCEFEKIRSHIDAAMTGEVQNYTRECAYPDGVTRIVEVTYIPDANADGQVVGFFSFSQDVTQRSEIERQLGQAQKMEAIGELTGGIAHDFNNLLMVIDGYSQRAVNDLGRPEKVGASLNEVCKASKRAADLTKQLLSFSRRQVIEKRVFRVEDTIAGIETLLEHSTGERYSLKIDRECDGVCVETDESELGQAIINLVINARDAMPEGGSIEVAAKVVDLDEDFTTIRKNLTPGRFVEVSVSDHGTGIDDDTLEHIFEPFFTTKDQGKGTGLGLAMVYGFAQHSGGTVEVESATGVGTTVKIYLPTVDRDPEMLIANVDFNSHGKGETVLLVEDDEALLELVRGMLDALGYDVLTASDGPEALEIEEDYDSEIDLILSDVVMPVIGGFEVASMIRESRPDVKVVFMSGYPNRASAAGQQIPENCQFLQKPVDPNRLATVIRNELDNISPTTLNNDIEATHGQA